MLAKSQKTHHDAGKSTQFMMLAKSQDTLHDAGDMHSVAPVLCESFVIG